LLFLSPITLPQAYVWAAPACQKVQDVHHGIFVLFALSSAELLSHSLKCITNHGQVAAVIQQSLGKAAQFVDRIG
jgi:hypothetical protein